ncbi:hypothetical protein LCGC14_2347920, partial [marine sediment metagenome]
MKKSKLISLVILSALLFGTIGTAFAYQEYLYRWNDDGSGETHGGCHTNAGPTTEGSGELELTISETGSLSPGEEFVLTVIIKNFTEATEAPYVRSGAGRITIGVPGYLGDNALFTSSLANQTLNRGERVDAYGSYEPTDDDNKFALFAPSTAGTYVLWAVVIAGVNQTSDNHAEEAAITYLEGSITITVAGGGGGDTIPGALLIVT